MRKHMTFAVLVALLTACNSPTAPEPEPFNTAVTINPVESIAPVTTSATGLAVRWYPRATATVTNTVGTTQYLEAFITTFDAPTVKLARKTTALANGGSWWVSFDRVCVQMDLAYIGGTIFAHAFYDKAGKIFGPGTNPEKIAECRPPAPIYCSEAVQCPQPLMCRPSNTSPTGAACLP